MFSFLVAWACSCEADQPSQGLSQQLSTVLAPGQAGLTLTDIDLIEGAGRSSYVARNLEDY